MSKKTLEVAHSQGNIIILQIKRNQPNLHSAIINEYTSGNTFEELVHNEMNRGRNESRDLKTFDFYSSQWPEIHMGARLFRHTIRKHGNKIKETRNPNYFLCNTKLTALELTKTIRNHWSIENSNHHIRDNVLLEDKNRIRIKAENMMVIRSFGYNLIQANKSNKAFSSQMEKNKLDFEKVLQMKGINAP